MAFFLSTPFISLLHLRVSSFRCLHSFTFIVYIIHTSVIIFLFQLGWSLLFLSSFSYFLHLFFLCFFSNIFVDFIIFLKYYCCFLYIVFPFLFFVICFYGLAFISTLIFYDNYLIFSFFVLFAISVEDCCKILFFFILLLLDLSMQFSKQSTNGNSYKINFKLCCIFSHIVW